MNSNKQKKAPKESYIPSVVETKSLISIKQKTGNIYESIVIASRRANQINITIREELQTKLEEFANSADNLEEIHENKEQIEVSRHFEQMPNPAILATYELMEDKIYFKKTESDLFR